MTHKRCIDVSVYQGVVDWETAKGSIDCAIIRAGYGAGGTDDCFERNITECNRLGIPCGVYWFSYAYTEDMAAREADCVLAAVKPHTLELPVAFDFEGASVTFAAKKGVAVTKELASAMARAFCGRIEAAGYYAMVYSNPDYLSRFYDGGITGKYDLWLAQWPGGTPDLESPPRSCGVWQYSSSGIVPGIAGCVDTDAVYRDYPAIMRANGLNGLGQSGPAASPTAAETLINAGWGDILEAMAEKVKGE